jgi:hypothetical protein
VRHRERRIELQRAAVKDDGLVELVVSLLEDAEQREGLGTCGNFAFTPVSSSFASSNFRMRIAIRASPTKGRGERPAHCCWA